MEAQRVIGSTRRSSFREIIAKRKKNSDTKVVLLLQAPLDQLLSSTQDLIWSLRLGCGRTNLQLKTTHAGYTTSYFPRKKLSSILTNTKFDLLVGFAISQRFAQFLSARSIPFLAVCSVDKVEFPIFNVCYDFNSSITHAFHLFLKSGHQNILFPTATLTPKMDIPTIYETYGVHFNPSEVNLVWQGTKESLVEI